MKTTFKSILVAVVFAAMAVGTVSCQENAKKANKKAAMAMKQNPPSEFPESKPDAEWQKELTPLQYEIMVKKGTEPAYNNPFFENHDEGTYVSAATGKTLFNSEDKFDSGTGWPSFTQPMNDDAVIWVKDDSHGMSRDEVIEKSTGLHLGHVFNDGPAPSHLRYCINSAALKFVPAK